MMMITSSRRPGLPDHGEAGPALCEGRRTWGHRARRTPFVVHSEAPELSGPRDPMSRGVERPYKHEDPALQGRVLVAQTVMSRAGWSCVVHHRSGSECNHQNGDVHVSEERTA